MLINRLQYTLPRLLETRCCLHRRYTTSTHSSLSNMSLVKPPWRVLFFGSDSFSLPFLTALNHERLTSASIISTLDAVVASKRCEVYKYGCEHNLSIIPWPLCLPLQDQYDVGVVVSFGHLIPKHIIKLFPHGIVNVHPSRLPQYRGAAPLFHTLLNGDTSSAISFINITPEFDVGPVLCQVPVSVPPDITILQYRDLICSMGAPVLLDCLQNITHIERVAQNKLPGTPSNARKVSIKTATVHWEEHGVLVIYNKHRALSEIFNLRTYWLDKMVQLLDMVPPTQVSPGIRSFKQFDNLHRDIQKVFEKLEESYGEATPGTPHYLKYQKLLCIKCKDGWCMFKNIIMKKPMSASAFYNGYLSKNHYSNELFMSHPTKHDILDPNHRKTTFR